METYGLCALLNWHWRRVFDCGSERAHWSCLYWCIRCCHELRPWTCPTWPTEWLRCGMNPLASFCRMSWRSTSANRTHVSWSHHKQNVLFYSILMMFFVLWSMIICATFWNQLWEKTQNFSRGTGESWRWTDLPEEEAYASQWTRAWHPKPSKTPWKALWNDENQHKLEAQACASPSTAARARRNQWAACGQGEDL